MIVGDRLAELLVENGIDRVFGLPGGQTLPLYEGIRKLSGKIEHVLMRDERSAGFAADAYARLTRKVGVCDATVGPGATNLVSPVAEAYCSSIPILAIISDIPRSWEYRRERGNASQAIRQLDIFQPISKWQVSVNEPAALDDMIDTAFRVATTGKPGPVVISVPDDVAPADTAFPEYQRNGSESGFPRHRQKPDLKSIHQAVQLLKNSRKTVLVAGGGVHISSAYQELDRLVKLLQVPVLTTISGKGVIAENHPQSFGVVGTFGNPVANDMLQEADLIFYVGCKIGQLTTLRFNYPPKDTAILHLDADPEELGRNYHNTTAILADAQLGLADLHTVCSEEQLVTEWDLNGFRNAFQTWYQGKVTRTEGPLKPQPVMEIINQILTVDDVVVCDASLSSGWASAFLKLQEAGHSFIAPRGLATLGWGAPAAIAAALATDRKKRILHFAGDGGFGYSVQELEVMVRLKLPVVTILFNNDTLGWIKHIQQERYQGNTISTDFNHVDFATVARGFGASGFSITGYDELKTVLHDHQSLNGPIVIDIATDQWETPVLNF